VSKLYFSQSTETMANPCLLSIDKTITKLQRTSNACSLLLLNGEQT
jgi:SUMO ligase MMS21 Smc5/6 complex component